MSKQRFSLGEVEAEDLQVPRVDMISRPPASEPVPVVHAPVTQIKPRLVAQPEPALPLVPSSVTREMEILAQTRFAPEEEYDRTSFRLPRSASMLLNRQVLALREQGHKKITRDAIMAAAVIKYLTES